MLTEKNKVEKIQPEMKMYYKSAISKTMWYWYNDS